jgi:retron-type reverse transcriptase
VIEPIVEKKFVKETFACIAGRGTHAAMRHTLHCSRAAKRNRGAYYVLKCDVSGFFSGVSHDILKKITRRSVSDPRVLNSDKILQDHFTLIKNMPQAVPRYGDVITSTCLDGCVPGTRRG